MLSEIDGSHISEEDANISEGDAGSNFLNSFENDNNYFDRNQMGLNNPIELESAKNVHHLPRESTQRNKKIYLILILNI